MWSSVPVQHDDRFDVQFAQIKRMGSQPRRRRWMSIQERRLGESVLDRAVLHLRTKMDKCKVRNCFWLFENLYEYNLLGLPRNHDASACRFHGIDVIMRASQILFLREQHGQVIVVHQILGGVIQIGQIVVNVAGGRSTAFTIGH